MGLFTTSDDVKIYYDVQGEGKPIVFVHGWSASSDSFMLQVQNLSKKFKVVIYDLRGHGRSERPEKGLVMKRYAEDLKELLEHLDLQEVTLVGWSMGSSILFEYVKNFGTERLSKAAIVDMTPKLLNEEDWDKGLFHGKFDYKDNFRALTTMCNNWLDYAEEFVKITVPYLKGEEMKPVLEMLGSNTPHIMYSMWTAMAANDYRDILDKIDVPTYIIYGEKSTLYSKDTAVYMNMRIPNSTLVPFENCTHFLVAENPDKFNKTIEQLTFK